MKDVDLEKEIDEVIHNYKLNNHRHTSICAPDIEWIAEHFFELGIKVKQESNDEVKIGETQIYFNDTMKQPYVGNQLLDLSCMKFEILKTLFKDGDNVEILIRKP